MTAQPACSAALAAFPAAPAFALHHRGFAVSVRREPGRHGGSSFGYAIAHQGLDLHASAAEFRTPQAADRAARRFVDDALAAFDRALPLDAESWTA